MIEEMRQLIEASAEFRKSVNKLWAAENPEEAEELGFDVMTEEDAQQAQIDAFVTLAMAEYRAHKALSRKQQDVKRGGDSNA